jgi:hypothetical protein
MGSSLGTLSRSRAAARDRGNRERNRIFLYSIPIIALVIVMGTYLAAFNPPSTCPTTAPSSAPVLQDFTFKIIIEISYVNSTGGQQSRFIIPPVNIGQCGGTWHSHQYDVQGISGRYPVYTLAQDLTGQYPGYSIVHVTSASNTNYTLGDFFAVWGQPLGPSNTLGFTTPPPAGQTQFPKSWYWAMCTGPPPGAPSTLWGLEPLAKDKIISLLYSNVGCG